MRVDVVSAEARLFSGEANEFYARSLEGEIGILPGHQPILLMLQPGAPVRVKTTDGREETFDVPSGGFLEFRENHLIVLAEATQAD